MQAKKSNITQKKYLALIQYIPYGQFMETVKATTDGLKMPRILTIAEAEYMFCLSEFNALRLAFYDGKIQDQEVIDAKEKLEAASEDWRVEAGRA